MINYLITQIKEINTINIDTKYPCSDWFQSLSVDGFGVQFYTNKIIIDCWYEADGEARIISRYRKKTIKILFEDNQFIGLAMKYSNYRNRW